MGIFIWMYILLLLIWFVCKQIGCQESRTFEWLAGFVVLWLILALRADNIGTDLNFYIPIFLNDNWDIFNFEKGYVVFNQYVYRFTQNQYILLAIISFISIFPISILFRKFSKNICFSYIIFSSFIIYHFTFSGLRQSMALGIIGISYLFLVKKNLIKFLLTVLLASTFHTSSIIFLIFYPLCNWLKITNIKYFILCIAGILIIFSLEPILRLILPIIFGEGKYIYYIDKDIIPAYNLLILLLIFFIFTFIVKKPSKELLNYRMASFLAVMCQSLGTISASATRIGYYFFIFIPLLLPQTIAESNLKKEYRIFITIGLVLFMIFFFFYTNGNGYLNVIPYSFFWE